MKRILQISAALRIGGAEKVARDLGCFAAPAGYETHYIVFGDIIGEYEQELMDCGCRIYHWPSPSSSYLKYYFSLKELMRENDYDIVHAHTMFNIGWAMLAAKQSGVPVRVAHAHSALDDGKSVKKQAYEKAMRQLILQNATHLISCGDAAGIRLYGGSAYQNRGLCILNGIDTARFAYSKESRARIRQLLKLEDAFIIGHVGHLMEVKNQSFLIMLLPEIKKRRANAKLLMLGEGPDRPLLEKQIRNLGLEEDVILTGNVRNVPDYLSAMDVFAFPSLYEGMPLSIIEVQANGLPCILSTGVPKDVYLTDLVNPLSLDKTSEWTEAVCNAQRSNPERYAAVLKEMGFDTDAVMRKFMEIYENT